MAELHRVLAEDGLLLATFLGPDWGPHLTGEERWLEDRVVMVVLAGGRPWDEGGPRTIVSEWWVRAHLGRAFEIDSLDPSDAPEQDSQCFANEAPP